MLLWMDDPIGHKQLDELDISKNQVGVPWCVVPLVHIPRIGPTCPKRCDPDTIVYRVLGLVHSWTMHVER